MSEYRSEAKVARSNDIGDEPGIETVTDSGSELEAVEASEHAGRHHHHPPDPNVGVARGRLTREASVAGFAAAAITLAAVILLALAIGNH